MRQGLWPATLRGQLTLIAGVIILIPLCLISLFLRQNAVDAYTQISTRAGEMSMREARGAVENSFAGVVTTADKVASDGRVLSIMKKTTGTYPAAARIDDIRTLRTLITTYEGEAPGQTVRLVFANEQQWLSNNSYISIPMADLQAMLAEKGLSSGAPAAPLWIGHNRLMAQGGLYYQEGISYLRIIRDMQDFDQILGYVVVHQPYAAFTNLLVQADITGESLLAMTDETGAVIAMGGSEANGQALWAKYAAGAAPDTLQVLSAPLSPAGWGLTMLLPQTGYGQSVARLTWRTAALSLALGLASLLFAGVMYRRILRRINHIVASMEQAQGGDLSIRIPVISQDELGRLEFHFNHMLSQLSLMMAQSKRMEEQDRLMRIRLLRSQINPHFLYNMLNSILWIALDYGADRVCQMIKALSDFYKIALQPGSDEATVGHELLHVQRYFALQALRGEVSIKMQIDVEDALREQRMPNMLLQPLVENCFIHGFVGKETGCIGLSVCVAEGDMQIVVEDDGVGMTPAQIDAALKNTDPSHAYGLYSIAERLRLRYGERASLRIEASQDKGCRVVICLPIMPQK